MAVPKKRTGKSAQAKRRANWKATKPETTVCSNCGQPVLAHTVCTACGYYKGQPVRLKDKAAAVEEVKKPVRKSKSTKAEAPVEAEETKVEEAVVETAEEKPKKTAKKKTTATTKKTTAKKTKKAESKDKSAE